MKTSVRYGFSVCPGVQEGDFYIDTNFFNEYIVSHCLHATSV
jgi:hypothetical protein